MQRLSELCDSQRTPRFNLEPLTETQGASWAPARLGCRADRNYRGGPVYILF